MGELVVGVAVSLVTFKAAEGKDKCMNMKEKIPFASCHFPPEGVKLNNRGFGHATRSGGWPNPRYGIIPNPAPEGLKTCVQPLRGWGMV